ncbi:hypothetical protein [Lysinibacillus fusiformis]|uniref:hypothetical protein n=1 Tax=Lysinibacillus fusiformis TaxID=28031 RepID=UPI00215B404C|nr:hypothetical protein [Lysinibacillus fusiformis]MCR8854896.1 hypothetical protein [Lysinibacillus fusiformis]
MSKFSDLLGKINDENYLKGIESKGFESVDRDMLSTDRFRYPNMGDFYMNAVNDPYYKRLKEAMDKLNTHKDEDVDVDGKLNENNEVAMSFYYNAPPVLTLGDHQDKGVIFFKGQVEASNKDKEMGYFEGDTFPIKVSTIEAGNEETKKLITGHFLSKMIEMGISSDNAAISVRLLGINTPEVEHWDYREYEDKDEASRFKTVTYGSVEKDSGHYIIRRKNGMDENTKINVFKPDPKINKWHEYTEKGPGSVSGYSEVKMLTKMDEEDPVRISEGKRIQDKLQKLIHAVNGEVYFMIDRISLNESNQKYPTIYEGINSSSVGIDKIKYYWSQVKDYNRFKYSGYNQWGQDKNGRWLGSAYIKLNDQWINLAKYVITQSKETNVLPDANDNPSYELKNGLPAEIFNLQSYDYNSRIVFDIHSKIAKEMDDRRRVQKDIFNVDFDKLKEWNVTIGDCTFFVPPTSIRVSQQATQDRLPILRGKGSITRGNQKVQKMIELTLYFNEDRGINGYQYKDKLPNGKEVNYYMNGLRSLISQFKFTPFLPIENDYINRILNIDAVTLANMQIVTNPSMPRLLTCVLTMQEFDFLQYMPEIPLDLDNVDEYYNPFSTTFNFALMRWYYQRAIQRGEALKEYSINDKEYMVGIEGSRTALFPMDFKDPYFKIFVANENHLQQMHSIKVQKNSSGHTFNSIGQKEKNLIADMQPIYNAYMDLEGNTRIKTAIDEIMSLPNKGKGQYFAYSIIDGMKNNKEYNGLFNSAGMSIHETRGKGSSVEVMSPSKIASYVNKLVSETSIAMYEANVQKPLLTQSKTYTDFSDNKMKFGIVYKINSEYLNESALTSIIDAAEIHMSATISLNKYIKSGNIVVEYEIPFKEDKSVDFDNFMGSSGTATYKFYKANGALSLSKGENAKYIGVISMLQDMIDGKGNATMVEEVEELNADIDNNMLETLQYDEVMLGEVRIKNLACVYGNNLTQVGLNGTEGYASQYLGGQDTIIELGIETTDEFSVGILNGLPKVASYLLTNYRLVIPSAPIRFESEITRLLGVVEAVIESVEIGTVPGQPGLYQINMRLVSVDRTMRHREGMRKVNEISNGGITTGNGTMDIKLNTFAELQKRFGEAELYPDLELPTIEELNKSGFDFLRHKFDSTRIYPDPDFYFNYGHVLQSEIFREAVIGTDLDTYDVKYGNTGGDYVVTESAKGVGVKETDKSQSIKDTEEACSKAESMVGMSSTKKMTKYIDNNIPVLNMMNTASSDDVWEIGEDIRVMLMEEPYAKMLRDHERGIEKGSTLKETAWLYDKLEGVRNALGLIDGVLSKPMNTHSWIKSKAESRWRIKDKTVAALLKYHEIFQSLGIVDNYKFRSTFGDLAYAAACARSGNKEYRKGLDEKDYAPDVDFIGFKIATSQDGNGIEEIKDPNDVVNAVEFGPFRTKMYSEQEIRNILGDKTEIRTEKKDSTNVNTYMFLLDPYYLKKASLQEIEEYKKATVSDVDFAIEAFLRICLVWLRKMIEDKLFPNLNFDVLSKDFEKELSSAKSDAKASSGKELEKEESKQIAEQINQYIDFLKDIDRPMDGGKAFLMVALAVCELDLYKLVYDRDFHQLNQLKVTLTSTSVQFENPKSEHMDLRRFLFALVPAKAIDGIEDFTSRYDDAIQKYRRIELDRKYIEFADDPDVYTRHAFYDMCTHDMRGRMARAFPSFYIVLVDEGREIGYYKLNDNFYNINAISEIQVHKSRKIPADTCRIVMSNLFHTFTQDDEDKVIEYEYSPLDAFNSIFRPGEIYRTEQEKRLSQQPLNKVKLTPGTRIHVRMGYGANAATLPVVFNGKITEVNAGDVMEIVCQGDGIELAQPILEDLDADEVENADKLFSGVLDLFNNASTPKEILTSLLTIKGSFWRKTLRQITEGMVQDPQRYGYVNFGDINYTEVFKNGEAVQNIFEAIGKPMWGALEDGVESDFNTKEAPKISIELMGKSFWDVLHICASATPDFIGAIAPFGMRSTVFHGHPRYYYAFDYVTTESGNVYEKRKPFQQYHIVTSYADIITNNIKADSSRIKTNAIGTFKAAGNTGLLGTRINQTPRMFVDWDIYPENQKSMIYDTQFYDKGIPMSFGIGKAIQWIDRIFDYFKGENEDKAYGVIQNGYPIAKRMTANALKNSMRDMYTGEIILMGSPTLKPHDRLYIMDIYEHMSGQVLVEAVTHSLTIDTGLTSSVTPDCISVVDDQYEKGTRNIVSYITSASMLAHGGLLAKSVYANKRGGYKPLTAMATWGAKRMVENSGKLASKIEGAVSSHTIRGAKAAKFAAKHANKTAAALAKLGTGTAAGGPAGFAVAAAWIVVEAGVSFMVGTMSSIMIQEFIKNAQVLTIFPLQHNGKVLTAGLKGSVGLVYGAPDYNKLGTLEKAFTYLDTETNDLGKGMNFIINIFVNEDIQSAARKYATRAIDGSSDEDVQFETNLADKLKGIAARESNRISGYEKLLISPRIQLNDENKGKKFSKAFEAYGLSDSRMPETQSRITAENTYIKNDVEIENMIEKGFLKLIWDESAGNTEYDKKVFSISGNQTEIKAYKKTEGGKLSYDLPFLKDEALSIMKTILAEAKKMMPTFVPEKEVINESYVIVSSALIVGGDPKKKSMANTGFSFTLEAGGLGEKTFLIKAIEKMYEYGVKEYSEGRSINKEIFIYNHVSGNKYQITILPPDLG